MKTVIEVASPSEIISVEDAHFTMLLSKSRIGCHVEMETESGKKYQWLPDGHLVPYKELELHDHV